MAETPGANDGSSSLKEAFEMYRAEHRREHERDSAAMEVRLKEHQHAHDREHQMREEAGREREARLDLRLATMNEIRQQLNDQASTFMRGETAYAKFTAIEDRMSGIERIQASRSGLESKVEGIDTRLDIVEKAMAAQAGQRGGSAAAISYIALAIGALAGLIGLFTYFAGQ